MFKFTLLFCCIFLKGCCFFCFDREFERESEYEPIFLSRTELNNSIELLPAVDIINSGKIYIIDNLLFVGEDREGFHIFDNSDPKKPVKLKFLKVPGSTDLAIRDRVLYINQATDLVTLRFDLSKESIVLSKRIEHVFPQILSPDGLFADEIPENSVVVNWKPKNLNLTK